MKNKSSRARMQMIFGSLLFALVLIAEMYIMTNYPKQYIAIAVIAVLALVCVYLIVDGFLVMQVESETKRNEQNEYIYKSEKAAFLVSKKNFENLGERLDQLEQSLKLPAEEIINAQKGIAKVSINRSRENTEALMNFNDMMLEQIKGVLSRLDELAQAAAESRNAIDTSRETVSAGQEAVSAAINAGQEKVSAAISASREALLESQEKIRELNEKALQVQEQELIVSMKDMELRLNNAIMQIQQTPMIAAPMQASPAAELPVREQMPVSTETDIFEKPLEFEEAAASAVEPSGLEETPASAVDSLEFEGTSVGVGESSGLDEALADAGKVLEGLMDELSETVLDAAELPQQEAMLDDLLPETIEETEPEAFLEPELSIGPESAIDSEPEAEQELSPEPEIVPEAELSPEPEIVPEAELSSEPEIVLETELSPEPEIAPEAELSAEPELAIESEHKELPPMPDLSDPNKPLSLDEIDALFATMGLETTEAAEDPAMPEPMIEPDLIIGSELIEGLSETTPEPESISEAEPTSEPEPIVVEAVKPDMPDLSDPNKALSADEIAALFANLA